MGTRLTSVRLLKLLMFSVLLAGSAILYAQDEKPQEEPKAKQEEPKKQDDAKPANPQDQAKPAKPDKQDEKMQKQDGKQENQPAQSRAGSARPGNASHIPDDKFRASFGRGHSFKAQTVIVSGQQQFQYGGYSFQLVGAWPVGFAYTDDCYIDYIDGEYFLIDLVHPGIRIAVIVVM